MPTAWFLCPYKRRAHPARLERYCAMDDLTPEILAGGGEWSEAEIAGNQAIVRVRATSAALASIGLLHRELSETEARSTWTPMRSKPGSDEAGQLIIFQPDKRQKCKTLDDLVRQLPERGLSGEVLALIGLWSAVGFGQGWRLSWDIIMQGAMSGYPPILGGAFPTTSVLDNFTGTNGTDLPVYSSNWALLNSAQTNLEIQSNGAAPTATGTNANDYWTTNFGPDSEVFLIVAAKGADGNTFESIVARIQGEGGSNTWDGYILNFDPDAGTDAPSIARIDNASATQLGAALSQEYAANDSFGLEIIGSTLQAYYKASGGSWAALGTTRSDSTYTSAGKLGFQMYETPTITGRLDDFGGGTVVTVGAQPNVNDAAALAEDVAMKMHLSNATVNDAPTVAEAQTMHMPIHLRMEKLS